MADITITRAQYDSLLAAANGDTQVDVEGLQKLIDDANGITRYFLYIRWQDLGGQPPTRIELGDGVNWPANQEFGLSQETPISREDVDIVLQTQATNPVDAMVTSDRNGIVGWTLLDDWDFVANAT